MFNSRVVTVPIARNYDEAYAILAEPRNYPHWSPMTAARFDRVGDSEYDWFVDLPRGRRILRFSPRNAFGVLDYTILSEERQIEHVTPVRLIRNDDGAELIVVTFQRPERSDEEFASDVEWLTNDFRAVATVVETL